jgi:hypothetical protein
MEWILPAFLGWLGGLLSALVATEFSAWLERRRARGYLVTRVSAELAANKRRLESAVARVGKTIEEQKPYRMTGAGFGRAVFNAGIDNLALLPEQAMEAVIRAYASFDDVDHIVEEWRWLESPWPVGQPRPESVMPAIRNMQTSFKERTELATQMVDDALSQLKKLA